MGAREELKQLRENRTRVWNEGQALLNDTAGRQMSGEERAKWDRINFRLDELSSAIDDSVFAATRALEAAELRSIHPELNEGTYRRPALGERDADQLRAFVAGRGPNEYEVNVAAAMAERQLLRSGADAKELRALYSDTGSVGSAVPTTMARTLVEYLEASSAMLRMPTTKVSTMSGEPMRFPKLTAHAIGTQVIAQGTTIGGTDPTFSYVEMGAWKYGSLCRVANEVIADAAVDMGEFLGRDLGRAVGRVIATDLVLGTGSGEPLGVMNAITGSGTIATGGSLLGPTVESLLRLQFSVNSEYRGDRSAAWLMNDTTAGTLRAIRENGTVGALMWQPSQVTGLLERTPDMLFGAPVYTDTNVASLASASKSIAWGAWNSYYVRTVGNLIVERDSSLGFGDDVSFYRAKWRVDGDLVDTSGAINILTQRVA